MAFSATTKHLLLAATLLCIQVFFFKSGVNGDPTEIGGEIEHDPTQIVAKALLCFNDKFVYSSCEQNYRLNTQGNINVPYDCTDQYCNGPCLIETHLVLNCIENILSNFIFYNKATIQDVRDTVSAGCSDSYERGNFNVAEHIQAEENYADHKAATPTVFGLVVSIIGIVINCLLL